MDGHALAELAEAAKFFRGEVTQLEVDVTKHPVVKRATVEFFDGMPDITLSLRHYSHNGNTGWSWVARWKGKAEGWGEPGDDATTAISRLVQDTLQARVQEAKFHLAQKRASGKGA